jgi:hypothetical protein
LRKLSRRSRAEFTLPLSLHVDHSDRTPGSGNTR